MTTNVEGAVRVSGVVRTENIQTGDGRFWDPDSSTWEEDAPGRLGVIRFMERDTHGDLGSSTTAAVGVVTSLERRAGGEIWMEGWIYPQAAGGVGAQVIEGMRADPPLYGGVSTDSDNWAVTVVDATITESDIAEQEQAIEEAFQELDALMAAAGDGPAPDDAVVLFRYDSGEVVERYRRDRIRAVTLVDIPAHQTGFIAIAEDTTSSPEDENAEDDGAPEGLAAAVEVTGDAGLAVAEDGTEWDPEAAGERLTDWCTARQPDPEDDDDGQDDEDGENEGEGAAGVDGCRAQGYLLADTDTGELSHLFVDVADDQLVIVPAAVEALPGLLDEHEGLSEDERAEAEATVCALFATVADAVDGFPACPYSLDGDDSDEDDEGEGEPLAAAHGCGCGGSCGGCGTHSHTTLPPLLAAGPAVSFDPAEDLFRDPGLTEATPIDVVDGRVFGHAAAWGVCHRGIDCGGTCGAMTCQTAPHSARGYVDFHRYSHTDTGRRLPVACGRITVGHGQFQNGCGCCPGMDDHACRHLSFAATVTHHDQLRPVAYVAAGEDAHGIWVSGVVAPEASDEDVAVLTSRRRVSGDWRRQGDGRELAEVLALSVAEPGFPVAQMQHGAPLSLVAAGRVRPEPDDDATDADGPQVAGLSAGDLAEFARHVQEATLAGMREHEARQQAAARLAAVPPETEAWRRRRRDRAIARLTR